MWLKFICFYCRKSKPVYESVRIQTCADCLVERQKNGKIPSEQIVV